MLYFRITSNLEYAVYLTSIYLSFKVDFNNFIVHFTVLTATTNLLVTSVSKSVKTAVLCLLSLWRSFILKKRREEADISMANNSKTLQLTTKPSRWINSTIDQGERCVFDLALNCPSKDLGGWGGSRKDAMKLHRGESRIEIFWN